MYLEIIKRVKNGEINLLKKYEWLKYLWLNENKKNINIENFKKVEELNENSVLNYVERTLEILENEELNFNERRILQEVLVWCEVAKCGSKYFRESWIKQKINLAIHNIGSKEIFIDFNKKNNKFNKIDEFVISNLIGTHGYVGQYIRGETLLSESMEVTKLLDIMDKKSLYRLLYSLNKCIIQGVSEDLYLNIKDEVNNVIEIIILKKNQEFSNLERIKRLRGSAIKRGENIEEKLNNEVDLSNVFNKNLWYIEPATMDFSFEEFIKLLFISGEISKDYNVEHISFEKIMHELYYDLKGAKKINIYKKRIIEKLLNNIDINNFNKKSLKDENIEIGFEVKNNMLYLTFKFSAISEKLIDFCVISEGQGALYERAIIMLYDMFQLRRDEYDRFNNEESYLETMNNSTNFKAKLIDYVVGDSVLDVGPGGGALIDLLEERLPDKKIYGVDISTNVIEALNKRKNIENKSWEVREGNALDLEKTFEKGSVSTIILSSIVHELFSYINFNGKRYNYDTLKTAFRSMFDILPVGGRIVIRDGVMTEAKDLKRIIKFKDESGLKFLERYSKDFKARKISYKVIDINTVQMPVNDAMEFLYTYTWGEESYAHEVEEQFGYFTPNEYKDFLRETLGNECKIIKCEHYLQEGYSEHLLDKIDFYDDNFNEVELPDSTIVIIVEKI